MKRYDSVCAVCGARDLRPFGQRTDGIHVLQCTACGHGIVEHFQDDIQRLYGDEYFSSAADAAIGYKDYAIAAEHGVAWAASLLRILKLSGQVLDIGCANGRALQLLGEGYDCFGIELNESMAQQATRAGVRIIARDLLDSRVEQVYTGFFDAVLAIAVFEHIPDFKEAFRTATALLKPDGILIFEVPLIQFAGDIWYRSSLEHLHYPTESSIEYLFREILHLPLTGSVINVQDFGTTYIGVTSPDADTARRAGSEYLHLITSDPALLHGEHARFRWHLDLMHAAHTRPEILALHRHLKPEDWTAPSLHRLFELWGYREEKLKSIEAYLPDVEQAKNWLEEQVRNWQQVANLRQETVVAYEAGKSWLEQQVRNWQQVAGRRQEELEARNRNDPWPAAHRQAELEEDTSSSLPERQMAVNTSGPAAPLRFPNESTTYLPYRFSTAAMASYGAGNYQSLLAELRATSADSYERAGVDRALAIACDLALAGMREGGTILDAGCSVGTITRLLAETGYHVTGVDRDIVASVQKWQNPQKLTGARRRLETFTCRFVTADIEEFLETTGDIFDVALLLSILHHFLEGYGYTGINAMPPERFAAFLKRLCSRVRSYLYVEVPGPDEYEEMPPDPTHQFHFPGYFVDTGLASDIHLVAITVATNGKPRRLYRVDLP
jgi:SAM-dependent methyltransferase